MAEPNGVGAATRLVGLLISVLTLLSILGGVMAGVFYGGQWFEKTRTEIEDTRHSVDRVTEAVTQGFKKATEERARIEDKVESEVLGLRKDIVPRGEWEKQMKALVPREEWEQQWRDHERKIHHEEGTR